MSYVKLTLHILQLIVLIPKLLEFANRLWPSCRAFLTGSRKLKTWQDWWELRHEVSQTPPRLRKRKDLERLSRGAKNEDSSVDTSSIFPFYFEDILAEMEASRTYCSGCSAEASRTYCSGCSAAVGGSG